MDLEGQVQPAVGSRPLLPLLRIVGDMLAMYGYPSLSEEFVELLWRDVDLLAALQRLSFGVLSQGGKACQR